MEKCVLFCVSTQKSLLRCPKTVFTQRYISRNILKNAVTLQHRNSNSRQYSTQQDQIYPKYLRNSAKFVKNSELACDVIRDLGIIYTPSLRQFHTSGRKDAFPPLIWAAVSFISKAGAVLTGRKYRTWLKTQPLEIQKKHHKRVLQFWAAIAAFGTALGLIYYNSHLQVCPITGRKRFVTLTKEQYMKVADFQCEGLIDGLKDNMIPPTHAWYNLVLKTAQRIVKANQDFPGMKDQKWVIHVVEGDEKNAFVLANGHIFVYTGMLMFVENEDQFAFILGHEMAHALLLHGAEQLSYSQFMDYIVIGVMAAIWTLMPNDGIAVITNWFYKKVMNISVHMPYSRILEKEADKIGLHLTAKACFDVRESSVLWHRMGIDEDVTGEAQIPEWLSTHPSHGNRVKHMNQLIPRAMEERASCKCDPLSDVDPRNRAKNLRQVADNIMIARASKANLGRVHVDNIKPTVPTFQSLHKMQKPLGKVKA
ncbi:metalloendopeptidase OMA1, mitochondrial-like [Ruditapes philippinarum]|uniref:metalloendopeptidase OMA1, mitochondrial-like n=1 Tax=Ruditapes philippinarum TaxID=129788 RepID=UPI00295A7B52|nr:metalloendopeptidase OMA1, mitochondrial-like [Ruditapes philippinarum]XP_060574984.1 metalloendopeptidase OMA1, mitochondrial-like [Ruditapes philippinarum]